MNTLPIEDIIKLQPKGLITIPKKLRTLTGLQESAMVRVRAENQRIIIEPVQITPFPTHSYTDKEINEFQRTDRNKSMADKTTSTATDTLQTLVDRLSGSIDLSKHPVWKSDRAIKTFVRNIRNEWNKR